MLLHLGHISHQLYLGTEALGYGCCAIGGYYQDKADELIGVDREDEFTVLRTLEKMRYETLEKVLS